MTAKKQHKQKFRLFRRTLRVLLGFAVGLFFLVLFIRSPWGQNIIIHKAVSYISNKTETKVTLHKMYITFDGALQIDDLFLEDKNKDTLLYSKSLEANIPLWSMIKGDAIGVTNLKWKGLRANIIRKDSISGYNFQFLIDAFASAKKAENVQDTLAKSKNILIGTINLNDLHVVFNDAVSGIYSSYKIGNFNAKMKTVNLEEMIFSADAIALSNSKINFIQNPIELITKTSKGISAILSANSITLKNVNAYYESPQKKIIVEAKIKDFYTEIPEFNLADQFFRFNDVRLKNSDISLKIAAKTNLTNQKTLHPKNTSEIIWPAMRLEVNTIDLENNTVRYAVENAKTHRDKINFNAIALKNLNFKATNLYLKDKKAGVQIKEFNFLEKSGFQLNRFAINAAISDKAIQLSEINIKLNKSMLTGSTKLSYTSLYQLITSPENTNVQLKISSFQVGLQEFFKFQPNLKENEYIRKLSKKLLTGTLDIQGSLAKMNISKTNINWGKSTKISVSGTVKNATNSDLWSLDIPKFKAVTKRLDLLQIVDENKLNIELPEEIIVAGNIKSNLNSWVVDLQANTSQGEARINGNFINKELISYDFIANFNKYNLGKLLKDTRFGALSAALKFKGSGIISNQLNVALDLNISKFQLNNYQLKGLAFHGDIKNGKGEITSTYKDENLNVKLNSFLELDSIAPKATINLELIGADLAGLGVINRPIKTGMNLMADFKGNSEKFSIETYIKDGVFVYDNRTYLLGSVFGKAYVDKDTTAVTIKNKLIDLELESNTDPATFSKVIKRHISSYFYKNIQVLDTILNPVILKLKAKVSQTPLLKDVFFINIKNLDTVNIAVNFNEKQQRLKANIAAPYINYSNNKLDSLSFSMFTDRDNFNFNLGFKSIKAGPFDIPKTSITGRQNNNELSLNFLGLYNDEKLLNVQTKITGSKDRLVFTVNPDSLLLNRNLWKIPENNEVILADKKLQFRNFKVTKENQSIEITNKLSELFKDYMAIDYSNFKISEFFNYLNPTTEIAKGTLNGNFLIAQPFEDAESIANLSVSTLEILKTDFGTLKVDARYLGNNNYNFGAKVSGGYLNLNVQGDYYRTGDDTNLDVNLIINEFKIKALNALSLGEINEGNGSLSGDFKVSGTTSDPQYSGKLQFKNAAFKIKKLNSKFSLPNETLQIDNSLLSMSEFTILDAKKNSLIFSGTMVTKNFFNPTFNLNIKAKNFNVLNATKKENESLFGNLAFNADAKLTGSLRIPKLNAQLAVSPETNLTYVLPTAYAKMEERAGVVVFVNRENPDAILTQTEKQTAIITGFDIYANLKIDKQAVVNIILDKETGDHFKVSGDGDFVVAMKPNGSISLTGVYEVFEGHYELNLYNLVNRKFYLAPGSRVSWSGDPLDAKLNVSAFYKLQTSALPLMASQISGEDAAIRNKYKQKLPFNVYLNINGELLKPKISFNLDMPEENQGAIGGQVYGRVQQVNLQEDELNRQVFSLLVLNRFYPDAGSDGSYGGFATIARDNLNDAVSEQLNAFSDKILGGSGLELDFGLQSFTDYQGDAPTDRTQLDIAAQKKLFNERLIVRVGSEVDLQGSSANREKTPLIGNVSLEYKITEDGTYRIRGFRKSEFENVIDGQTIVSGIALIFTREFNEYYQLWDAIFRAKKNVKSKK
ncbi:translocation/assembly module TamB domain-containing protein [Polaribacter litorisediminis]|uniref:translocation/assembly module TamB domain-containing protein n=1 Tax=Polaribacter litorisediminis TaxID=1908341 RepID=UPI001CBC8682|nr:translocation/assembly module TamB domain-containing protein [Polaribacter litorisediminis]